jgi:uncharacterized protein
MRYFRIVIYLFVLLGVSQAISGAYEDFFKAVQGDDASTVTQLLARGFDPNTLDPTGQAPLFLALRAESFRAAAALMAHPDLRFDKANGAGETPAMMAALKGSLEWTRRLIERGAQVNRDGWAPLHYAASGPNPAVVGFLIERGAQIDALSPRGTTALMLAARYGAEESVALLLERGASAKLRDPRAMSAADFARTASRESLAARLEAAERR